MYLKHAIGLTLVLVCGLLCPQGLRAEYFTIDHYQIDISVSSDGYFDVQEKILVTFTEPRHGIFRTIPTVYRINGKKVRIKINKIRVVNYPKEVKQELQNKVIRIGDEDVLVDGTKEYVIEYRVTGAFLWLEDHTEFYWNIIGTNWDVPIAVAEYNITFPDQLEIGNDDYAISSGPEGLDQKKAMVSKIGSNLRGKTTDRLHPGEGVTLAVKLPLGAIANTSQNWKVKNDYFGFIPFGGMALLLFLFGQYGRNRKMSITDEHYPPQELNVSEAGAFFDHVAHNRDLLSLIPQWGMDGLIRMKGFDDGDKADYYIEKLEELSPHAPEYQHEFFKALFADGPVILLSDLKNTFYNKFNKAQRLLKKEVKQDKWVDLRSKQSFHKGWLFIGGLLIIATGILALAVGNLLLTGLLSILLGVLCIIINFLPAKRSPLGFELENRIRGLKQFLKRMPEDELTRLTQEDPDYFERLFPYAVAFGLDKAFINKFKTISERHDFLAPSWYYYGSTHSGYNRPHFSHFSDHFQIKEVSSAFTSMPASSSGSGGSFSGSTGGGFGGGGGGSW